MTVEAAADLLRQSLLLALIISAPILLVGLLTGLIISILQAITQVQELTLSFVPKIFAMMAVAVLLMPWIGHRLIEYAEFMFALR